MWTYPLRNGSELLLVMDLISVVMAGALTEAMVSSMGSCLQRAASYRVGGKGCVSVVTKGCIVIQFI